MVHVASNEHVLDVCSTWLTILITMNPNMYGKEIRSLCRMLMRLYCQRKLFFHCKFLFDCFARDLDKPREKLHFQKKVGEFD